MSGVNARFSGGRVDGQTLQVEDRTFLYVAVIDGVPQTVRGLRAEGGEDLIARAAGTWECYVRDAVQECAGEVAFFCMQPLDRSSFGRGTPPPPPARVLARQDPP